MLIIQVCKVLIFVVGGNTNKNDSLKVFTDKKIKFTYFSLLKKFEYSFLHLIISIYMKTIQKFILLQMLFFVTISFAQTGVIVTYYDGTTQGFNVESTGKLYFNSDNLNVKINNTIATPTTIPVTIIRKITFSTTLLTNTFGENKNNFVLYPNPSSDVFKIKSDLIENLKVEIYSLQGQLVFQGNYQSDQDIDVTNLSSGLYLVQVNGLTIKFSKK
jgi:hypothetical protein